MVLPALRAWSSRGDETGATSTEYALLLTLIAVAILGAVALFGGGLAALFADSCASLPGSSC